MGLKQAIGTAFAVFGSLIAILLSLYVTRDLYSLFGFVGGALVLNHFVTTPRFLGDSWQAILAGLVAFVGCLTVSAAVVWTGSVYALFGLAGVALFVNLIF